MIFLLLLLLLFHTLRTQVWVGDAPDARWARSFLVIESRVKTASLFSFYSSFWWNQRAPDSFRANDARNLYRQCVPVLSDVPSCPPPPDTERPCSHGEIQRDSKDSCDVWMCTAHRHRLVFGTNRRETPCKQTTTPIYLIPANTPDQSIHANISTRSITRGLEIVLV